MKFTSFFCDDIRHESDGRRSFIGVYPTSTVVEKFPYIFPKVCLFVEADLRHGDDFSKAEIVIFTEEKEHARLPVSDNSSVPVGKGKLLSFEVTMSPVVVTHAEVMHAKIEVAGISHTLRHLNFRAKDGESTASKDVKGQKAAPSRKIAKKVLPPRKRST